MANVNGSRSLNFSGTFDVTEVLANQQKVIQGFGDLKAAAERAVNAGGTSPNSGLASVGFQNAIRAARLELERLKAEEQALRNQTATTGQATAELTRRFQENRLAQQELAIATREARRNQQAAAGSYREAQLRLTALGREIRENAGGLSGLGREQRARIEEYRRLNAQLTEFDRRMGNNQRNVGNYRTALEGIKGFAASFIGIGAALGATSAIIRANKEISDSLSDVQRTTGLTAAEADNLSVQLKKIDTRTSLKGLLDIAIIGGQLGIAKDQLGGFTRAVDQLAVSLSGELQGGAEGIAKSLGVLDNVFKISASNAGDVEKSYNQIGSAILGLGQSGLATGDFLTDFGERVGGLAKQAGLSLPVILSYGAVLQENGVSAEVAGTSFKRLLSALVTNRGKLLAVAQLADANLTLKSFTDIINTDAKKALDLFFAGLAKGGTTTSGFNDILKSLRLTQGGVSQSIAALANNQEALNGHIRDSTKDFNEASIAAEQFELKNNNLAGSLEKLGNFFTNITSNPNSGVGKFFQGIIDYLRISLQEFDKLVSSKSWSEFFSKLGANSSKPFELNEAFKSVSKRTSDNQNFIFPSNNPNGAEEKLKAKGAKFTQEYLDNLAKTYKRASEARKEYEKGVKNGDLIESKDTIKDYKDVEARAKDYYETVLGLQKKLGFQTVEVEKKAAAAVIPDEKGDRAKKAEARRLETAMQSQRKLQSEIDALTNKGRAKQQSDDEQELADIDAKYRKLREKAIAFNKASTSKGMKVDTGGLLYAQSTEEDAVRDKQAATRLKTSLDAQKLIYADFEQYKTKLGEEGARERFKGEIGAASDYLSYLNQQRNKLLGLDDTGKGATAAGANNRKQLEEVDKAIALEVEAKKKRDREIYANAVEAAKSGADKILDINRQYEQAREALGKDATQEQLTQLRAVRDAAIRSQNEENAYRISGLADLFSKIDSMTRERANQELDRAKGVYDKQYADGLISAQDYYDKLAVIEGSKARVNNTENNPFARLSNAASKYRKQLSGIDKDSVATEAAQRELFNAVGDAAAGASSIISEVAGSLSELGIGGEGLQDALKGVTGILDGAQGIAKGIASGNPVDIVTGSIKLLTSAIQLFNTKDKRLQKQIDGYKAQLDSLSASYKQLEREAGNAVGNSIYTTQAAQIENLKKQQEALTRARDAEASKKKKDQGVIDQYNQQIADIPNQIDDINKAISEGLIQTNFRDFSNSLADAFTEAFKSGENSAKAFDDVFNNVIANAIKNSLKLSLLDPVIKSFTDDLTKYARENGNSVVGFDFEKYKSLIKVQGDLFNQGLKESEQFFKSGAGTGGSSSLKGGIQASLTEETGSVLASVFKGAQISLISIDKKTSNVVNNTQIMINIANSKLTELVGINNNTLRTANNTDRLAALELSLASIDSKIQRGNNYNPLLSGSGQTAP